MQKCNTAPRKYNDYRTNYGVNVCQFYNDDSQSLYNIKRICIV